MTTPKIFLNKYCFVFSEFSPSSYCIFDAFLRRTDRNREPFIIILLFFLFIKLPLEIKIKSKCDINRNYIR